MLKFTSHQNKQRHNDHTNEKKYETGTIIQDTNFQVGFELKELKAGKRSFLT